jgi:uncharacterized delta-60 repeat protein
VTRLLHSAEVARLSRPRRILEKSASPIAFFPTRPYIVTTLLFNPHNFPDPPRKEQTMKSFLLFALSVSLFAISALGQPNPDTLWTRTYGGGNYDEARSVQQTADGGYIAAGCTYSFGAGAYDFYLLKTDSLGDTLWTRTYGRHDWEWAYSVRQTSDGGYAVAGYTHSLCAGSYDFYLVKTNSQGDTLWTRTYGESGDDVAYSIQQTADGGYVVAGHTSSFGAGSYDFYLVKTDSLGDTVWTRTYGGSNYDYARSVQQTGDGGYIVAGYTMSFGAGTPTYANFYLVKTNSEGNALWTHAYGGVYDDRAYSVQQTSEGGYIVAGYTQSFGAGYHDFYLVMTDSLGDTLWTRTYGGSSDEEAYSVQQTSEGGYIVAGYTQSFGAGYHDFYLVKTNSQGDTLWTRTYGGSNYDEAYSVQQTADGGYIVAGYGRSFGGDGDFYLVKTGPENLWHLVISTVGGYVVLNWVPMGATSYNIYGATAPFVSGVLLDVTSSLIWVDINTPSRPSPYFYYVTPAP